MHINDTSTTQSLTEYKTSHFLMVKKKRNWYIAECCQVFCETINWEIILLLCIILKTDRCMKIVSYPALKINNNCHEETFTQLVWKSNFIHHMCSNFVCVLVFSSPFKNLAQGLLRLPAVMEFIFHHCQTEINQLLPCAVAIHTVVEYCGVC